MRLTLLHWVFLMATGQGYKLCVRSISIRSHSFCWSMLSPQWPTSASNSTQWQTWEVIISRRQGDKETRTHKMIMKRCLETFTGVGFRARRVWGSPRQAHVSSSEFPQEAFFPRCLILGGKALCRWAHYQSPHCTAQRQGRRCIEVNRAYCGHPIDISTAMTPAVIKRTSCRGTRALHNSGTDLITFI